LKFADSEIAQAFKENFEKYQKEMEELEKGADKPEAQAAGEEAAEAISKLSTSDAANE